MTQTSTHTLHARHLNSRLRAYGLAGHANIIYRNRPGNYTVSLKYAENTPVSQGALARYANFLRGLETWFDVSAPAGVYRQSLLSPKTAEDKPSEPTKDVETEPETPITIPPTSAKVAHLCHLCYHQRKYRVSAKALSGKRVKFDTCEHHLATLTATVMNLTGQFNVKVGSRIDPNPA